MASDLEQGDCYWRSYQCTVELHVTLVWSPCNWLQRPVLQTADPLKSTDCNYLGPQVQSFVGHCDISVDSMINIHYWAV